MSSQDMSSESTSGSTNRPAPGSRRRRSGQAADKLADRKRAQNRISQQCARERQAAYIRQLESVIDALKPDSQTAADGSEDTQQSAGLLKAHLALIDEKRELEDSLLRFRQRLLSLGNLATSAAGDAIFDRLEKPPTAPNDLQPDNVSEPLSLSVPATLSGTQAADADETAHAPLPVPFVSLDGMGHQSPLPHPQPGVANEVNPQWIPSGPSYDPPNDTTPGPGVPDIFGLMSWPSPLAAPTPKFPFGAFDINATSSNSALSLEAQIPHLFYMQQHNISDAAVIANSTIFADQVKAAARHVMARSTMAFQPPGELVKKLVSTAVEVIGALAGLEPYIYGVDFSSYMEHVMRWRISNSQQDRLAIPVPFRPTPLQFTTPDHPMVIDFINWPYIRDQMIIYSAHLDLDAMARDIVLNTVVELPRQRVAVNIYDLFFSYILPRVRGDNGEGRNSMLYNPGWIYLRVPSTSMPADYSVNSSPTQAALAAEIAARMGLGDLDRAAPTQTRDKADKTTTRRAAPYGPQMTVSRALSHFGIDQPSNWKLSKDFARKYFFIDCSLDVSRYDMVSCSSINLNDSLD